jgi:hypothetical protein
MVTKAELQLETAHARASLAAESEFAQRLKAQKPKEVSPKAAALAAILSIPQKLNSAAKAGETEAVVFQWETFSSDRPRLPLDEGTAVMLVVAHCAQFYEELTIGFNVTSIYQPKDSLNDVYVWGVVLSW